MAIDEDITLKKLEAFQSFMMLDNMGCVSEVLGQSTVSVHRALHSLEEGLRYPLFKRDGRKLIPLSAAYVFAGHVERTLTECEAGVRRTREVAGFSPTTLKIDGFYSMTIGTLPRIFTGLKMRRSVLDIELTLSSNHSLLVKPEDGRLDAIVIALGEPLYDPDPLTVPMSNNEILFVTPLGSPYTSSAEIDLQTVRSEEFVALGDDSATHHDLMAAFDKAGFAPQIALRVGDIFSLTNLVSGDVGYALLPRRVADFSPKVQLIPLAARYAISQHIVLVMQRNRERDPNLLALLAECWLLGAR